MLRVSLRSQGVKLLLDRLKPSHSAPWARYYHPLTLASNTLGLWRPPRMKTLGSSYGSFSSSAELAEQTVDEGEDGASVMEYLQSLGIDIAALEELELPKSKAIIKERLDYLQNVIGLTIKDINDYPLMIGCSVRKNLSPVVQYLQTLKVTKSSLPVMIRKYPQVLHSSVAIDLIPNVRFIQGLGIELKQVGSVLTRYPQLLGYRIEGTMSTSVAYLVMIGVDKRQIGPVLTEKPEIMGMRVSNNLRPKVEFIAGCGIPHLVVGKMIENRPYILDYDVEAKMRPAVDTLLEFGVRKESLPGMLIQYPELLGLGTQVKDKVETKLPWLTAKVGVRREDMAGILEKLPQILAMSVPTNTKRVHALRELGLTKEEVAKMIAACPQLMGLSIEKRIVPGGGFLVKEMGRDVKELLEFPAFLTYDLDTRIRPRFAKIKEKGVTCSLAWMLNCSDAKFEERLKTGEETSEEVEAGFDTVGRLRAHEQEPSSDVIEDEDKHRPVARVRNSGPTPRAQASRPKPMEQFEDKDRPSKQSFRDPPRAQASRSRLVNSSEDRFESKFEDKNGPSKQSFRDPPRAQASRPRLVNSSENRFEDKHGPSRQRFRDSPRAQSARPRLVESLEDEFEDKDRPSRQSFRDPPRDDIYRPRPMVESSSDDEFEKNWTSRELYNDSSHAAQASRPRSMPLPMMDSSDEEAEDEYGLPEESFGDPPRAQSSRPRPISMMDSSEDELGGESILEMQKFKDPPRPVMVGPYEDEVGDAHRPRRQNVRAPPDAQATRPRLVNSLEDEFEGKDRPSRQSFRDPPRDEVYRPRPMVESSSDDEFEENWTSRELYNDSPHAAQASRPRSMPLPMMDSSDEEAEDDYGPRPRPIALMDSLSADVEEDYRPPRQHVRDPPRAQASRARPISMMDSSEDELEDKSMQKFKDPPRPVMVGPYEDEVGDAHRPRRQNARAPPRAQATRPRFISTWDSSDDEFEDGYQPSNLKRG